MNTCAVAVKRIFEKESSDAHYFAPMHFMRTPTPPPVLATTLQSPRLNFSLEVRRAIV
jgi:hypothetical protein